MIKKILNTKIQYENLLKQKIIKFRLENGLTILIKENNNIDLISIQLSIKTGSIHEDHLLGSGVSHLLEHMIFKGSNKRKYYEINQNLYQKGASINAYTTFDHTSYYINGPTNSLEISLDILADIVFNSSIEFSEFNNEKLIIEREMEMCFDDPINVLYENTFKTVYDIHPYKYPIIGIPSIFKKLSHHDVHDYYKKRYSTSNAILTVVGSFVLKDLLSYINKYFALLKLTTLDNIIVNKEPKQYHKREASFFGNYKLIRGNIVFRIPSIMHDDIPGLIILANFLGQGISSLLWQQLREQTNLVYEINSFLENQKDHGLFYISYICAPINKIKTEEKIYQILQNLYDIKFNQSIIDKTEINFLFEEINGNETISNQASQINFSEVTINEINLSFIILNKIRNFNISNLHKLILKYLNIHNSTIISLEPFSCKQSLKLIQKKNNQTKLEKIELKNGVRILFQNHLEYSPIVNISIMFKGGSRYEKIKEKGITKLLSILLTKDTKDHSTLDIANNLELRGISFNEISENNTFGIEINFIIYNDNFDYAIKVLKQAILHPIFNEKTIEIERNNQISLLKNNLDDLHHQAILMLRKNFLKNDSLKFDELGTIKTINNITKNDLIKFYQKTLCSNNIVLSVISSLPKKILIKKFNWLELIPKKKFIDKKITKSVIYNNKNIQKNIKNEQSLIIIGYPDVPINDSEFETAEIINELMNSPIGRFYNVIREKLGLSYILGTQRIVSITCSIFFFYIYTHNENIDRVIEEVKKEINLLKQGFISEIDLQSSKVNKIVQKRLNNQNIDLKTKDIAFNCLYNLDKLNLYERNINLVSIDSIKKFVQKKFTKDQEIKIILKSLGKL